MAGEESLALLLDRDTVQAHEAICIWLVYKETTGGGKISWRIQDEAGTELPLLTSYSFQWRTKDPKGNPQTIYGLVVPLLGNGVNDSIKAGTYKILAKKGNSEAFVTLKVLPSEQDEILAVREFGEEFFPFIFVESRREEPKTELLESAQRVIQKFPKTITARYCEAYIAVSSFKKLWQRHRIEGGEQVYGVAATELKRVADALPSSFLKQQVLVYASHALGLCGKKEAALKAIQEIQDMNFSSEWLMLAEKLRNELERTVEPPPDKRQAP
jgi:hypothetical protein